MAMLNNQMVKIMNMGFCYPLCVGNIMLGILLSTSQVLNTAILLPVVICKYHQIPIGSTTHFFLQV